MSKMLMVHCEQKARVFLDGQLLLSKDGEMVFPRDIAELFIGKTIDEYAEEWYDDYSLIDKVFEFEEGWPLFILMSLRKHYGKEVLKTLEDVDPGFLEKVLDDAFFEGMKE